jgi:nitrogen fixation/metabolism regulation signal transduction histidine kinase
VIHNLVQNALDAVAEQADGRVEVSPSSRGERRRQRARCAWRCRTTARAFAEKVLKRAFEPYVTTKSKGTGLGPGGGQEDRRRARGAAALGNLQTEAAGAGEGARVSLSFALCELAASRDPLRPRPQRARPAQARSALTWPRSL